MFVRLILLLTTLVTLHGAVDVKTTVPVLLWSNQLKTIQNSESSFTEPIDASDVTKHLEDKNIPVVVFVQNELNVEHFTDNKAPLISQIFDDSNNNPMFFTNVKNTKNIYSKLEDQSLNRVVRLPENNLASNQELIKSYVDQYSKNGSAIFVLTGDVNNYLGRHQLRKRATDDKETPMLVQDPNCFLLYTTLVTLDLEKIETFNKVEKQEIKCEKDNAQSFALDFANSVRVEAQLETTAAGWTIKSMKVTSGGKTFETKQAIRVLPGYSYSCAGLAVDLYDQSTPNQAKKGTLSFTRFQLQPFKHTGSFVESSDCAVWFTIPIWMSLIVVLILLTILYSGVRALMSITTPDRFENPKNRPLIITNFDE